MKHMLYLAVFLSFSALLLIGRPAYAAKEFSLHIKGHHFIPESLTVPAGEKIKLVVHNDDAAPEEFESYKLNREKIIPGNGKTIIFIGPLDPGTYPYFGDFNPDVAKGQIVAE